MMENLILGAIQGIAEWLPVSSEGLITLVKVNFFYEPDFGLEKIISLALFLHFGTFLAALVYFRKEVRQLIKTLFNFKESPLSDKKILNFLAISTLISGLLGLLLIKLAVSFEEYLDLSGKAITLIVGFLLLITAFLLLKKKDFGNRKIEIDLKPQDAILLGMVQGFAVLPGLSRSGLTVATLLLRKFDDYTSLRLSFLMSLPIVLAGNIFLNLNYFQVSVPNLLGLLSSFVLGFITIHALLSLAKKINFGYFVLIFGILVILSTTI